MHVLSFPFNVLSFCGVWLPIEWETEKRFCFLYRLFSFAIIGMNYIFVLLELVLLTVSEFDINFFTAILFTLLTAVSFCGKAANFIVRREKIINLADMLLHKCCLPCDPEEFRIEKNTNDFIRGFTIMFNGFAQVTLLFLLMTPILQESHQRELPFQIWLPYDLHDSKNFWLTWACEIVPLVLGILINVTTDVLVSGFILQACMQIDFLRHRLNRLPDIIKYPLHHYQLSMQSIQDIEKRSINQAILHHRHIIKFIKAVTEAFDLIIIEQFIASALVLSVIVYELAIGNIPKIQKVMAVGYFICMLIELFSYCWFGNEILLKSIEFGDDIYKLDWTVLSDKSKKTLLFIMLRTSRPVVMCYGSLIILNVDSFKNILKITYSVFNVLKESLSN